MRNWPICDIFLKKQQEDEHEATAIQTLTLQRRFKMIENDMYGGFIVSRNVYNGIPVRYSFREKSSIEQLNGWNLLSEKDDDEYIKNPDNFIIINAESINKIAPVILEIFEAPYGSDLFWLYEEGVFIGFYDLTLEREITIDEILENS